MVLQEYCFCMMSALLDKALDIVTQTPPSKEKLRHN